MSSRILCVDKENNDQAACAQAYLEILRLAGRNNTSDVHTIFRDVTSAGCAIDTTFTRNNPVKGAKLRSSASVKVDNTSLRALKLVLPNNLNSDETNYVFARTANRKIQGVSLDHLYWDYIICFRTSVKEEMERLKKVLVNSSLNSPGSKPPKVEIVLLKASYSPTDHSQNAVNVVKALDIWVHNTFKHKGSKWSIPDKGIKGVWRSKQIAIPEAQYDALCAGSSKSRWNAISVETKCNLAAGLKRDGMRLITITGERSNLGGAAEKLALFWT